MSNYVFSRAPRANIPRSVFRRNHSLKTTIGVNYLYPIYVDEALPSDTFEFKHEIFGRLTTPLTPLMDDLYLDTFFFAVPVRLVDDDFKRFMGESKVGIPDGNLTVPMLNTGSNGVDFGSLFDYLGIPPKVGNVDFCAWFPRAYNLIYNDWFRDENLIDLVPVAGKVQDTVNEESLDDYVLRKRCKRLDYFTGGLPWPQKGDPVSIGLSGSLPVYGDGNGLALQSSNAVNKNYVLGQNGVPSGSVTQTTGELVSMSTSGFSIGSSGSVRNLNTTTSAQVLGVATKEFIETSSHPSSGLYADMSEAAAITVNQLREAVAVQQLLESWSRSGTRYTEIILGSFGCQSPDARLQRPEYLGGSSVRMNVTTVAQTSQSSESSPLGNLASFVTVSSNAYWKKSFTEHTIIIGLANVRAKLSYSQGLPRMFSRTTKLDFYWPELANLGEQAILNKEIFVQGNDQDEDVFAYQERWAEYRYHPDTITGAFRPTHPQSLDYWHLSQEFESLPLLNQSFIEENVPIERVVAVPSEPPLMLWGDFELKCARPMPLYSVPGLQRL